MTTTYTLTEKELECKRDVSFFAGLAAGLICAIIGCIASYGGGHNNGYAAGQKLIQLQAVKRGYADYHADEQRGQIIFAWKEPPEEPPATKPKQIRLISDL